MRRIHVMYPWSDVKNKPLQSTKCDRTTVHHRAISRNLRCDKQILNRVSDEQQGLCKISRTEHHTWNDKQATTKDNKRNIKPSLKRQHLTHPDTNTITRMTKNGRKSPLSKSTKYCIPGARSKRQCLSMKCGGALPANRQLAYTSL